MKGGSTPILAGLQQQIDNWRLMTYLQRRDECRDELLIPRPPKWTDTTPALAAQIYDVPNSSLLNASHSVKLIWDKHWHKGNQAKGVKSVRIKCPLCNETESQQHFTRNIMGPPTYVIQQNITVRPLVTFQQQGQDQPIHQFLGVISNPRRYCYKIVRGKDKDKAKLNSTQP